MKEKSITITFPNLIGLMLEDPDFITEIQKLHAVSPGTLKRWSEGKSIPAYMIRKKIIEFIDSYIDGEITYWERMKKRCDILQSIEEAEEEGLYELSEHLTSNIDLDYED